MIGLSRAGVRFLWRVNRSYITSYADRNFGVNACSLNFSTAMGDGNDIKHQESRKRPYGKNHRFKNNKKHKLSTNYEQKLPWRDGANDEVLLEDIQAILKLQKLTEHGDNDGSKISSLPEVQSEIELEVSDLSSTGDGLASSPDAKHVYVVPFTVPGDSVIAKPYKHFHNASYSLTDLIKVISPSKGRDDSLIKCRYFAQCSGCQFQMMPYEAQLAHKKSIVEKAYRNFSGLNPDQIPQIGDTIGSPLEYGYRTKLTPHFDGPPGGRRDRRNGKIPEWPEVPPIGFMLKGTRKTIDIEDCPIGTDTLRLGMKRERDRVSSTISTFQRGATLLLRESTARKYKAKDPIPATLDNSKEPIIEDYGDFHHSKTCITDPKATSTEYIDDFIFKNPAGSFFQNNNSILSPFTSYIRQNIISDSSSASSKISYLVDAYCGSGLFTITLSSLFKRSIGIDISSQSIDFATENAILNNLPDSHAKFITADAAQIFREIDFPAEETVVVIDPPRKGCDRNFLEQLLEFAPQRIVYVSCNVHTQARDVGVLVAGREDVSNGKALYNIESLRGFDFFPQTGHVEGVAVLAKKPPVN